MSLLLNFHSRSCTVEQRLFIVPPEYSTRKFGQELLDDRGSSVDGEVLDVHEPSVLHDLRELPDLCLIARSSPDVFLGWSVFVDFEEEHEKSRRDVMGERFVDRHAEFHSAVIEAFVFVSRSNSLLDSTAISMIVRRAAQHHTVTRNGHTAATRVVVRRRHLVHRRRRDGGGGGVGRLRQSSGWWDGVVVEDQGWSRGGEGDEDRKAITNLGIPAS